MQTFWFDREAATEMVEVHYTWTPLGSQPDWDRHKETEVLGVHPGTAPAYRSCSIELPKTVEGEPRYLLHSFFLVIGRDGHQEFTQPVTEEIGSRDVTLADPEGRYTAVALSWSIHDWSAPNYHFMALEGLPLELPASPPGGRMPEIYEFVRAVPLPHLFRGRIWGPKGATVHVAYHLLHFGSPNPQDDMEAWDNNAGRNYQFSI